MQGSMFTKKELKQGVVSLAKKYLFPDFSNKLVWILVVTGISLLPTPKAIFVVLFEMGIEFINVNEIGPVAIPSFDLGESSYIEGLVLILCGLVYGLLSRLISSKTSLNQKSHTSKDGLLFDSFLKVLPSDSMSITLLKNHDFKESFDIDALKELISFVNDWSSAENCFVDEEMESNKQYFLDQCLRFQQLVEGLVGESSIGIVSISPDRRAGGFDLPEWAEDDIVEVNKKAREIFESHQLLIKNLQGMLATID